MGVPIFQGSFADGVATNHSCITGNIIIDLMTVDVTAVNTTGATGGAIIQVFSSTYNPLWYTQVVCGASAGLYTKPTLPPPIILPFPNGGLILTRGDTLSIGSNTFNLCNSFQYFFCVFGHELG